MVKSSFPGKRESSCVSERESAQGGVDDLLASLLEGESCGRRQCYARRRVVNEILIQMNSDRDTLVVMLAYDEPKW